MLKVSGFEVSGFEVWRFQVLKFLTLIEVEAVYKPKHVVYNPNGCLVCSYCLGLSWFRLLVVLRVGLGLLCMWLLLVSRLFGVRGSFEVSGF